MMSWLGACVYDRFMRATEAACLSAWRAELLTDLRGTVLEIGAGTGVNLGYYPRSLARLVLSEPDRFMRRKLEQRLNGEGHAALFDASGPKGPEVLDAPATQLPVDSGAVDVVVSTLVLCSVEDPSAVLAEAHRVLRPGGRLVFLEHVAADDVGRFRWQKRIEPFWKRFAGNCHLTRRTLETIERASFSPGDVQHDSMRKALPFVRPTIRGTAIKA